MTDLAAELAGRTFLFGRLGGVQFGLLTLAPDGSLAGYSNDNERYWHIEGGKLVFLNHNREPTTVFDDLRRTKTGLQLVGNFVLTSSSVQHIITEIPGVGSAIDGASASIQMNPIAAPKRNLIIVRAGAKSLHTEWGDSTLRNWDIALSCYSKDVVEGDADYVTFEKGPKWNPLYNLIRRNFRIISQYDYICLADDDLLADVTTWNRIFDTCQAHELLLAQPALTKDSYYSYEITLQDENYKVRYTNFVEVMCPIFAKAALPTCLPTMAQDSKYGWGQDFIWPLLLGEPPNRIGIIDSSPVKHTRPVGHSTEKIDAYTGAYELLVQYGLSNFSHTRTLGGIFSTPI